MKSIIRIACSMAIVAFMLVSSGLVAGASTFELEETYPVDGQTNTSAESMSVKLYFNQVIEEDVLKNNDVDGRTYYTSDSITLQGPDGKNIPLELYLNPKDKSEVLAIASQGEEPVLSNSEYTLVVDSDFVGSVGGPSLSEEVSVTYKTQNTSVTTTINVVMMVVMMGAMVFFTQKSMKKQDDVAVATEEAFNPYKEAKRTGKSVKEVIAIHEKEIEKKRAKEKAPKKQAVERNKYKVKQRRSSASAGSQYVAKMRKKIKPKKEETKSKTSAKNKKKK